MLPFVKDPKTSPPLINARAQGISINTRATASRPCLPSGALSPSGAASCRRTGSTNGPLPRCGLIALDAIWEFWRDREGGEIDTVAIITCDANATVAPLHDRMPVVLGQEHFEAWLDCKGAEVKAAQELLRPPPDDLFETIEMRPKRNDSRRDEPGIKEPLQTQMLVLATSRSTTACRD